MGADSGSHGFDTDLQKLVLGAHLTGKSQSQMEIAAVMIYDRALSGSERQDVEEYLQAKYVAAPNAAPLAAADAFATTRRNATSSATSTVSARRPPDSNGRRVQRITLPGSGSPDATPSG